MMQMQKVSSALSQILLWETVAEGLQQSSDMQNRFNRSRV